MIRNDGFNRDVADWLIEQAGHSSPDYLDEILARTTRTRQRPAWSSLERWLPVQSTARFAPLPRMAWLLVILGLVLALGATAVLVGSRIRDPLPPRFGMAGNGTVIYGATDGDIYALDTATNLSSPLIAGPTVDSYPSLSPDGSRIVFNRLDEGMAMTVVMQANADGSNIRSLTNPLPGLIRTVWSPDSTQLALVGAVQGTQGLWVIGPDDAAILVLREQIGERFGSLGNPQWRPNGEELVFLAGPMDTVAQVGLFLIKADGEGLRAIIEPSMQGPAQPALSPDGTRVAYSLRKADRGELHIVDVDTGVDALIAFDGTPADQAPQWSPDGRKLVFERYNGDTFRLAVGLADGGPVVEIGPTQRINTGGTQAQFSPDGTKVLAFYDSDGSSWILDPLDGSEIQLADDIASPFTAQRAAP